MINFVDRPTRKEHTVIEGSLLLMMGLISGAAEDKFERFMSEMSLELFEPLGKDAVVAIISDFLEAHRDVNVVFAATDYHFLMLYRCLQLATAKHNAGLKSGGPPLFDGVNESVTVDTIAAELFWDVDFLSPPELLDDIPVSERDALGFSPEVCGIIHNLPPHPDELKLRPVRRTFRRKGPADGI